MEEQLRIIWTAFKYSPVSIMITDSRGDIEYCNSSFSEITGYSPDEVMGK